MRYRFEGFELDTERFELWRDGAAVPLEPQVFEVLSYLVAHRDRLVGRQELLDHVWPEHYITEAALSSRLMAARKAIGDNGKEQRLIRTVHGRGFRFVGEVQEGEASPQQPSAPRSVATAPALPAASTTFVGRAKELARLEELVARPEVRLVTVAGPGGVGKTRLAMALAQRLRARGEACVFAGLEGAEAPEIPARVTAAAGAPPLQDEDTWAALARRLAAARTVLILDNFEEFVRAAAGHLAELLRAAPLAKVVLTSRVVAGLQEEWLFALGGLETEVVEGLSEAGELFRERCARAGRVVAPTDFAAIEELCRLVDGMPLALELAAALTRYLSLPELATRLQGELAVLRTNLRDVAERHRSLPGLIEESFRHLTVEQMRVILSLSVFEGSFSLEAAEAVAGATFESLAALVDRSLLHPRDDRFSLHPLLRQFARERLHVAEDELRVAHAAYFAHFLSGRTARLEASDQLAALDEVAREWPEIARAWAWMCHAGRLDLLERCARPAFLATTYRSRFAEDLRGLDVAIAAVEPSPGNEALLLELLVHRSWALMRVGRGREVPAVLAQIRALQKVPGVEVRPGIRSDPDGIAWVAVEAGLADYRRAAGIARRMLERAASRGDRLGEAEASLMLATSLIRLLPVRARPESAPGVALPEEAEAGRLLQAAREILAEAGDRWLLVRVATEEGVLHETRRDDELALAAYQHAADGAHAFGDLSSEAAALIRIADVHLALGRLGEAETALAEAAVLVQRTGDVSEETELERSLGALARERKDLAGALEHTARSIELAPAGGIANNLTAGMVMLGALLTEFGEPEPARELYLAVAAHPMSSPFQRAAALSRLEDGAALPGPLTPPEMEQLAAEAIAALKRMVRPP